MKNLLISSLVSVFAFSLPQAAAAEISLVSETTIYLEGEIQSGDFEKFRATLSEAKPPLTLVLNSPGGDLNEALLIADLVRRSWISTEVTSGLPTFEDESAYSLIDTPIICDSACALIFSAGVARMYQVDDETNGRPVLGFHRAFLDLSINQAMSPSDSKLIFESATKKYSSALMEYGAPAAFIDEVLRTKSNEVLLIGAEEFYELYGDIRVFGDGIPWLEEYVASACGYHLSDEDYKTLEENYDNEIGRAIRTRLTDQNKCRNDLRNAHQTKFISSIER